jgi:hypothetical protein
VLVAATPGLAGCANPASNEVLGCHGIDVEVFSHPPTSRGLERAGEQPVSLAVWVENRNDATIRAEVHTDPVGRVITTDEATDPADPASQVIEDGLFEPVFFPVGIDEPPEDGTVTVTVETEGVETAKQGFCGLDRIEEEQIRLAEPEDATQAEGGKGAIVHTVGWYTDGQPFYHTMDRYEDTQGIPTRPDLGSSDGEPLKVYVYNESSDEMPERYNDSGYNTTIPGFNEALKGLATVGGEITYLEPEEAYTREGSEDHPLYGEDLVFYIEVVEVRTVPCEVPQPVCTAPDGDEAPDYGPLSAVLGVPG